MVDAAPSNPRNVDLGAPAAADFTRTRGDLARWSTGDATAFDELWRRYRPGLEILVASRIRSTIEPTLRGRLDADDVLQDVALTVLGKLGEFDYRGPGSLLAWMTRIATHTINDWLDYWRAGKRHPRVEIPAARLGDGTSTTQHPAAMRLADSTVGQATALAARERRRRLAVAMADLPEREHGIVLSRFFFGASWGEIATLVGAASAEAVRKECYLKAFPALAAALAKL